MPRIKTTPMVRFALWALRIYLLVLLSLIGLKFARVFSGSQKRDGSAAGTQAGQTNSLPAASKE
jgi:hypothetical protein